MIGYTAPWQHFLLNSYQDSNYNLHLDSDLNSDCYDDASSLECALVVLLPDGIAVLLSVTLDQANQER